MRCTCSEYCPNAMLAVLAPAAPHCAGVLDKFGHVGQGIVKSQLSSAAATAATAQPVTHTTTCPAAHTNILDKRDFGKIIICISCMVIVYSNLSLLTSKCRFGYDISLQSIILTSMSLLDI